jgi:hypothetical protein
VRGAGARSQGSGKTARSFIPVHCIPYPPSFPRSLMDNPKTRSMLASLNKRSPLRTQRNRTKFHPCPLYPESCPLPDSLSPSQKPRSFPNMPVTFGKTCHLRQAPRAGANERCANIIERTLANNIGVSAVAFAKSPRISPESTHSRLVTFDKHREHYRANIIEQYRAVTRLLAPESRLLPPPISARKRVPSHPANSLSPSQEP